MPRLTVWMVRTALLYLGVGFTFGALMLYNKGAPFEPNLWRLLPAHIEFVLLGWTLQLAMGIAFWIMPRFSTAPRYGSVRRAWLAYALLNVGVLSVAAGGWFGVGWLSLLGRVADLLAALLFVAHIFPRIKPLFIQPPDL